MTPNAERLANVLASIGPMTIAVSGGVDSMTLAAFAHRRLGRNLVRMVHGASPAVPGDAGQRIRDLATLEGWQIDIVDAGEFADPEYRANPVNRCYFCKSNLYRTLAALSDGVVLSGTNTDDLGDYRPGLQAARKHAVRHPYVEAEIDKKEVRALADALGLPQYAALPSSPCLSSRVETGLPIVAHELALIDTIEAWCRNHFEPQTVRCRVRRLGLVIELDQATYHGLGAAERTAIADTLRATIDGLAGRPLAFAEYRRGSAFVGNRDKANPSS